MTKDIVTMFSVRAVRSPQENTQLFKDGKSFVYALQLVPHLTGSEKNQWWVLIIVSV